MLTPVLGDHEGIQTLWVLFSVFLLKFPLVSLLWWFIVRNKEWPVRPPKWSDEETREILAYLVGEADRSHDRCPTRPPASRTCSARPGTWPTGSAASSRWTRSTSRSTSTSS